MEDKIKTGHCIIDGIRSFVRKVNYDNKKVCFFLGGLEHMCESFDRFKKRNIKYL